eukprot:TRINITY_DN11462_c0_g1_i3.p1 TRINITY_DN11462_c0_g1~~TRINITY_DN11462_c0_g1_i3.p1  ORF type:complete len:820 (-),score=288.95 TRINITY_DN11462_c0_g1_i3:42-2501(-)
MSRLIVKNLPFSVTEAKLRNSFSPHGDVTDLQLKYKNGKFRGFGFVGFLTEEGAKKAKDYLDGTFIGAAKIKVEMCKELGQHGDQKNKDFVKEDKKKVELSTGVEKHKEDPKFQEFMSVHNKEIGGTWGNDSGGMVGGVAAKENTEEEGEEGDEDEENNEDQKENKEEPVVSDLDYLKSKKTPKAPPKPPVDLFTVKITGLPYKTKKKDIKLLFTPLKPTSVRVPPKIKGIAFAGFLTEKEMKIALNKNRSFCGEHQIQVFKHTTKSIVAVNTPASKWSAQEAALAEVETVGESGRIFVRNLSYTATEEDISDMFTKFGPLTETSVPVDRLTRKYKGFAFVTFMMPEHAVAAFSALDGTSFMGRLLHLIPAKAKVEDTDTGGGGGGSEFKKAKDAKLKASAGSSYNWNSLFLGTSAVADVMAEQYGVDKAKVVMDQEGKAGETSAAVKLALGETEIVGQTRAFLEQEGVELDVFSRKPDKRSKMVILAKNLPARTSPEELRDLFSKFGVVNRMVLPLHCLTCIIEFADPGEARAAFTKLAYSKFHNAPLYLEWAPENTFSKPFEKGTDSKEDVEDVKEKSGEVTGDVVEDDDREAEEGSTLFVKNLNFSTTDEELKTHFQGCGSIQSATVAIKKDIKSGDSLSMGFGFITYYLKSSAEKAIKTLQQSSLSEHCLELKRSTRASTSKSKTEKEKKDLGKPSTKLLVRNIPFQANKEEITQIFKTFGELSAVRLPRKMAGTGDHRGFAFIEFSSVSDAKAAFNSLVHSTHLYGRRLVLEWAQGETTLEELRDKTKQHWGEGRVGQEKRTRFEIGNAPETME